MKVYLQACLWIVVALWSIFPASAYDFQVDGIYYELNGEGVTVTNESGGASISYSGNVIIPSTVSYDGITYSVTRIGSSAFWSCGDMTSITIPETVTSIGDEAFGGCVGLLSITLPESVTSIGSKAFLGCIGLTTITVPEAVTNIGDGAFRLCLELTSVTWNARACGSGSSLFGNTRITALTFGGQVEQIPAGLCKDMSLTTITIPESVKSIGDEAFAYGPQLKSVTVHAVTPPEIGSNTFDDYGMPLYVPAGCKEAYQAAEYWRYFMNVKEMESSVGTVLDSEARIYVENHTLHVENVEGDYRVYTTTGQLVYAGHAATVSLADAGVYVVRTSSLSQKVMVK